MLPMEQGHQPPAAPQVVAPVQPPPTLPPAPAPAPEPANPAPVPPAVAPTPAPPTNPPAQAAPERAPATPSSTAEPSPTRQEALRPPEPGAAEPASSGKVSMRFTPAEDAWIQVVDSKGMRFSKLVRAGASEVVSGTPPFKLVVGNAANVGLVYNGHRIDLKPFIGEKVARLTLE